MGRLQQSVAEAEKELDDAVRVMQDIKMRNIKGLQHIEAAQDAAGRNLESKALKAHAEESQLAMHDQVSKEIILCSQLLIVVLKLSSEKVYPSAFSLMFVPFGFTLNFHQMNDPWLEYDQLQGDMGKLL